MAYDAVGNLISHTLPDGTVNQYAYDANKNLISITPPSRPSHLFTYNPMNLEASYTPPRVVGADTTSLTYNLDRKLTRINRPDSKYVDLTYDSVGRLSNVASQDFSISQDYETGTGGTGCCGNPSRPVSITRTNATDASAETLSFTYDGKFLTSMSWNGIINASFNQSFNADRLLKSRSVNGGISINYAYDNDGVMVSAGSMSYARNAQSGFITGMSLGSASTSQTFNPFGEVASITTTNSGASVYSAQFTRDNLGRITRKMENTQGIQTTYDYSYDLLGRLIGVSKNGIQVSSYSYDANSNRVGAVVNGATISGSYDVQDKLLQYSGKAYTYSPNGDLLTQAVNGMTTSYKYDAVGNLLQVTTSDGSVIDYIIDGQDRRIGKKVNGTLAQGWIYADSSRPIAELDSTGNVVSNFVYGSKLTTPDYMIKGNVAYRIVSDNLGSPRLVINTVTGAVIQQIDYDEFGVVTNDTNPGFQPFGFTGGLLDQDTKLVRIGARDYNPEVGRWTAKDPKRFKGNDLNLYSYTRNDPINLADLIGLAGGTTDCSYYDKRCSDSGFGYYCDFAKYYCRCFDNNKKNNCIRKCLIDGDSACCSAQSDIAVKICNAGNHLKCYNECSSCGVLCYPLGELVWCYNNKN